MVVWLKIRTTNPQSAESKIHPYFWRRKKADTISQTFECLGWIEDTDVNQESNQIQSFTYISSFSNTIHTSNNEESGSFTWRYRKSTHKSAQLIQWYTYISSSCFNNIHTSKKEQKKVLFPKHSNWRFNWRYKRQSRNLYNLFNDYPHFFFKQEAKKRTPNPLTF